MLKINPINNEIIDTNAIWANAQVKGAILPRNLIDYQGNMPVVDTNQALKWSGEAPVVVDDFRGETYYSPDGETHSVDDIDQQPDPSWSVSKPLTVLAADKRNDIRVAYSLALSQPVTVNAVDYHGGYDSVTKLDGAKRLAEMAGLSSVTFYGVNNVGHELTIAEAEAVIMDIGLQVQSLFAKKQGLMIEVDSAVDQAALDAINW